MPSLFGSRIGILTRAECVSNWIQGTIWLRAGDAVCVRPAGDYGANWEIARCFEQSGLWLAPYPVVPKDAVRLIPDWEEWPRDSELAQPVYELDPSGQGLLDIAEAGGMVPWEYSAVGYVCISDRADPEARPVLWRQPWDKGSAIPVQVRPRYAEEKAGKPVWVVNPENLPERLSKKAPAAPPPPVASGSGCVLSGVLSLSAIALLLLLLRRS